jgi:hypothetical protein
MNDKDRRAILRANAVYLMAASVGGLRMDVRGIFLGLGPESYIVAGAPYAGVGFLESHGLALIFSIWLWRAAATRAWHFTGAAVHALLGTANLVFWQIFIAANILWAGYLTTSLHWLFALLQVAAAITARENTVRRRTHGDHSRARVNT